MDDNNLLMIVLAFIVGYCLPSMMKNMCGSRLIEGAGYGDLAVYGIDEFAKSFSNQRHLGDLRDAPSIYFRKWKGPSQWVIDKTPSQALTHV